MEEIPVDVPKLEELDSAELRSVTAVLVYLEQHLSPESAHRVASFALYALESKYRTTEGNEAPN